MNFVKPKMLKLGDKIGIIAPAGCVEDENGALAAKKYFERQLEDRLSLTKVQSPLFVREDSGLQDALSGVEKSVRFQKDEDTFEVVHSLAKWKRDALERYSFPMHTGLYTDMKAIRKDEEVDDIHSLFVEQWVPASSTGAGSLKTRRIVA